MPVPSALSGSPEEPEAPPSPDSPVEADTSSPGSMESVSAESSEAAPPEWGSTSVEGGGGAAEPAAEEQAEEEPPPTVTARWSKEKVTPDHNSAYPPASAPTDTVPEEAKVKMLVDTENVPDGTAAEITVMHCGSGSAVPDGTLSGLEVRGNKVVDPATGAEPEWVFQQRHLPWDPYDTPWFYFSVTVDFQGLSCETPSDPEADAAACLRVLYWHVLVAETSTLSGVLPECNDVRGILDDAAKDSKATVQQLSTDDVPLANLGSLMRNTYVFHVASHGSIKRRADDHASSMYLDSSIQPPDFEDHTSTVPAQDKGRLTGTQSDWKSVVCIGTHTPKTINVARTFGPNAGSTYVNKRTFTDATDLESEDDFPSVPRYLFYSSTCLTGWEPGFADRLIARGCRNVLCFKRTIPDSEAPELARDFYREWMNTYNLDPEKIPDCFVQAASSHYDRMRPVLYGDGGSEISGGSGLSPAAIAAIVIGAVVVGAAIGVAAYMLLSD
jgi:hypothetical protein